MGIDAAVWAEAQEKLGVRDACIAVVSMLERFSDIRSPGAYLRALGQRAVEGRFDGAGMMAGLARRQQAA